MKQLTLMDFPDDGKPPPLPASFAAESKKDRPRYTRLPIGHRRTLCDDCVELIHELGVIVAPLPSSARHRRICGTEQRSLCEAHTQARRLAEGKAAR